MSRWSPPWTVGIEIELLAPRGVNRLDLARQVGASVRRGWHLDTEPSLVPNMPIFHNLTPSFEALDEDGGMIARFTDDLTLQDDLDRRAPPRPGWFRVVGDDIRLLRLAARHLDADAPLEEALEPMRALFEGRVEVAEGGIRRLGDAWGSPIVMAAPLPGERERPCEIVTPPLRDALVPRLVTLINAAKALDFTVPAEAALHVHVDGAALCSAPALQRLVRMLDGMEAPLRQLVGTNPRCRRLGAWSPQVKAAILAPDFAGLPWEEARRRLAGTDITKYVDLNLRNLVHTPPGKHTVEWRILPVWMDVGRIVEAVALLTAIVQAAVEGADVRPGPLKGWLASLPMAPWAYKAWVARA